MKTKLQVLLVGGTPEDHSYLIDILSKIDDEPPELHYAANFNQGLKFITRFNPDLILVNYHLDNATALDFMAAIKKQNCIKPVIILSEHFDYKAELSTLRAGADRYLKKWSDDPYSLISAILNSIERANALEAMRRSESRMRGIFYYSSIGISLVDLEGLLVQNNPAFSRIVGYTDEDLCAMSIADDLIQPRDEEEFTRQFEALLEGQIKFLKMQTRFLKRDKRWIWVELTMSLFHETSAPPQFVICLTEDVTEKKQIQHALQRSEAELRELSEQLLKIQEEERRSVSSELHDSVGGNLGAMRYTLDKIKLQCFPIPTKIEKPLTQLESLLVETMEEIERISVQLHPPMLYDLGINATLKWLVHKHQQIYEGQKIDLRLDRNDDVIPDGIKIVIYRIAQEALHNAAKHSGANSVILTLTEQDDAIIFTIEDNGSGFPLSLLQETGNPKGLGLRNMQKRAELSGGKMTIKSSDTGGTSISATWPLSHIGRR